MSKIWLFCFLFFLSPFLPAQENTILGQEDVWKAFQQYNPVSLQKASLFPEYDALLRQVASSFSAPRTLENEVELIALVKNFDNSIILHSIGQEYAESKTWQIASGTMPSAVQEEKMFQDLIGVVESLFKNTLEVKKIQISLYKEKIKEVKKQQELLPQDKKEQIENIKEEIKKVKKEIKELRKNNKQKIRDTAQKYFSDIKSSYQTEQKIYF
ncbi:MAG: hypothetical protein IKL48_00340 [Elusimicrobiaceae bacterium]|nr:hypothetical protein [Elusimicrobiaceae bacterium]